MNILIYLVNSAALYCAHLVLDLWITVVSAVVSFLLFEFQMSKFQFHGSVHHTLVNENTNLMQQT